MESGGVTMEFDDFLNELQIILVDFLVLLDVVSNDVQKDIKHQRANVERYE